MLSLVIGSNCGIQTVRQSNSIWSSVDNFALRQIIEGNDGSQEGKTEPEGRIALELSYFLGET